MSFGAQPFAPLRPLATLPCTEFVDRISSEDYAGALNIADSLIEEDGSSIPGYFLKLTTLNNRSIDFEDEIDLPELLHCANEIIALSDQRISAGDSSALLKFYRGSTVGFQMIHALRKHDFIDALMYGSEASKWLEKAVAIDSTLYDAYVGLGNYYYFKSKYSGILRSTGIVSDQREQGKRLLRVATEHGLLTKFAGKSSLAWIAISEKDYDLAIKLANELLKLYPNNRAFNWCIGNAQKKSERWGDALQTYQKLLTSVRSEGRNNHYNEIGCLHSMAQAASHLNNWKLVVKLADEALSLPLDPEIGDKKKKDLKQLDDLRKKGKHILASLQSK